MRTGTGRFWREVVLEGTGGELGGRGVRIEGGGCKGWDISGLTEWVEVNEVRIVEC